MLDVKYFGKPRPCRRNFFRVYFRMTAFNTTVPFQNKILLSFNNKNALFRMVIPRISQHAIHFLIIHKSPWLPLPNQSSNRSGIGQTNANASKFFSFAKSYS